MRNITSPICLNQAMYENWFPYWTYQTSTYRCQLLQLCHGHRQDYMYFSCSTPISQLPLLSSPVLPSFPLLPYPPSFPPSRHLFLSPSFLPSLPPSISPSLKIYPFCMWGHIQGGLHCVHAELLLGTNQLAISRDRIEWYTCSSEEGKIS